MAGNLPLNNSRKTTARLFAATFLCTVGTTLLSQWCFRFYEVTSGGLSPHSLFVAVASVLIVTAGPRLSAAFPPKYLASLGLIAIFASALTIASVPSWALAGSGATVIASAFLEVIVCRSLLILPNSAMRKVFVAATVGGALIGSYFPIDTSVMLFVAPACITIAVALAVPLFENGSSSRAPGTRSAVRVRRRIALKPRPTTGLIMLAFVAHLASANAAALSPEQTAGAYIAALATLWLCAIIHDDTSHISLIRCLVLISTIVCVMRLSGSFNSYAVDFVETALGIIVWTGVIVVALDLATYAETPFSTIMGAVYLLLTGPAALIYLASLLSPSLDSFLLSRSTDAVIVCLLVFCGLYLLNEQSLDGLFWGAHDGNGENGENGGSRAASGEDEASFPGAPNPPAPSFAVPSGSEAVDAVGRLAADAQLTAREQEVLSLLAEGRSAPFVAEYLCIERSTAKTHIARIYAKLGVHTRQELISLVLNAKDAENLA